MSKSKKTSKKSIIRKRQVRKGHAQVEETTPVVDTPEEIIPEAAASVPEASEDGGGAEPVKVAIDRKEFSDSLKLALDFTEKKGLHVLNTIRFVSKSEVCTVHATDLDVSFTKSLPAKGGEIDRLIPAEVLYKEIRALDPDIIGVELDFRNDVVSVNGRCEIVTLPAKDFPKVPNVKGAEYIGTTLPAAAAKVVCAASTDEYKHNMKGIFFDLVNGKVVATDGHRLHYEEVDKTDASFILSRKAVALMTRHSASSIYTIGKNSVSMRLGGGVMTARFQDGDFPDYKKIISLENPIKVTFKASDLLRVIEGALPMVDKTSAVKGVALTINGSLVVQSQTPGLGNYKWQILCASEGKGDEEVAIGFNASYIIDAIKAYAPGKENDGVMLELHDSLSPCIFNKRAIIMPMRLI